MRVALLDAAGELLTREGPGALTTRRLAAAAGTTTQSIYTLFAGKEGVVRAMYREGFARLARRLADVPRGDDPRDYLLGTGRAYRAAALASPNYYAVMFERPVPEFVPGPDDRRASDATLAVLEDAVRRCAAAGLLRRGTDPAEVARWLWAVTHGLVSLELAGHLDLGPRAGVSAVFDRYLGRSLAPFLA